MFEISKRDKTRYANRRFLANAVAILGTVAGAVLSVLAMTKLGHAATPVTSVYDMALMLASPTHQSAWHPMTHGTLMTLMAAGLVAMSVGGLAFANGLARDYGSAEDRRRRR